MKSLQPALFFEDPTATQTGIALYNAIMDGHDDEWIKDNILTVGVARGMQTRDPIVYDRVLWPRTDYIAPKHTTPWVANTGLDRGTQYTRPTIFLPFPDMDLFPWSATEF